MKTLKITFFSFSTALILSACSPSPDEARIYNDQLMALENPLSEKEFFFIEQLTDEKSAENIKAAYDELAKQIDVTITDIGKIEAFDNSSAYLDATKEYFTTIKSLVDNEYKAMAALALKPVEEITDEDSKKYDELALSVEEKSKKVLEKVLSEQQIFAGKYKFGIEKASE